MAEVRKWPKLKLKTEYAGVAEVIGRAAGKDDWSDADLVRLTSLKLVKLTPEQLAHEAKIFLYGLTVKMSPRAAASALLLTWEMRTLSPIETRMFPEADKHAEPLDSSAEALETEGEIYTSPETDLFYAGARPFVLRTAVTFLAASTLKMFAKSPTGWEKAWGKRHIQDRYGNFHKETFPFGEITPSAGSIATLADAFQGQKIYLGTLGRILYALTDIQDTRQTDMLFEQHLACTRLHIIPQFLNAQTALKASTADLLSALDMGQNSKTLGQLKKLIDKSLSKPMGLDNRGTWRYARLFDHQAFALLQTKYCADTVAILAGINQLANASKSGSDPMSIAVIKQMGTLRQKNARQVAYNIHHYFTCFELP